LAAFDSAGELGAILEDARNDPAPDADSKRLELDEADAPPKQIEVVCP